MRKAPYLGISTIEVMVVIAIIGAFALFSNPGMRLIVYIGQQGSRAQIGADAEIVLYNIIREVRNANSIDEVTPGRLRLTTFNFQNGYDSSALFAQEGTIIYEYDAIGRYLKRTVDFGGGIQEKKIFKDMIVTPTAANYIFKADDATPGAIIKSVNLALRLSSPSLGRSPLIYEMKATLRSDIL